MGAPASTVIATTALGALAGERVDGVVRFLGIPYAAPPLGPLRWRAPQPAAGLERPARRALIREIRIDPKEYPILEWRWKVGNILRGRNVQRKEGDDYPARLYITLEADPGKLSFGDRIKYESARLLYGQTPPLRAINYIWEGKAAVGTVIPNPYTDRTMMIVVESGPEKTNQWVGEARNVFEDYRKAFGEDPPMISGVALMTDTDNTGEAATAYYGEYLFPQGRFEK